jgi:hypothetical protein
MVAWWMKNKEIEGRENVPHAQEPFSRSTVNSFADDVEQLA